MYVVTCLTIQWDLGVMNFWPHFKTVIVQNEVKMYCLFTLLIFRRAINDTLLGKKHSFETHLNGNYCQTDL